MKPYQEIIIMGDSLSDRGGMKQTRPIVAFIAGLDRSPLGRFTDDEVWGDLIARKAVKKALEEELEQLRLEVETLKQKEVIGLSAKANHKRELRKKMRALQLLERRYLDPDLDHHKLITFKGQKFLRSYAEGGLTAHDWSVLQTKDVASAGARAMVATLSEKRRQLFDDDKRYHKTPEQKANTLVIEWSGANDLATVTKNPTPRTVAQTVAARIINARTMMNNGYNNFVLFNLPNFSNSPRYQAASKEERENVEQLSNLFNTLLQQEVDKLKNENPGINIEIFDANQLVLEEAKKNQHTVQDEHFAKELVEHFFDEYQKSPKLQGKFKDVNGLPKAFQRDLPLFKKIEALSDTDESYYQKMLQIIFRHARQEPKGLVHGLLKKLDYFNMDNNALKIARGDYFKHGGKMKKIAPGELGQAGINFYDDVHPTRPLHVKLAQAFWAKYGKYVDINQEVLTAKELVEKFLQAHQSTYDIQKKHLLKKPAAIKDYNASQGFINKINYRMGLEFANHDNILKDIITYAALNDNQLMNRTLRDLDYHSSKVHPDLIKARKRSSQDVLRKKGLAKHEDIYKINMANEQEVKRMIDDGIGKILRDLDSYIVNQKSNKARALIFHAKQVGRENPITKKGQRRKQQIRKLKGEIFGLLENKTNLQNKDRALEVCIRLQQVKSEIESEANLFKSDLHKICDDNIKALRVRANISEQDLTQGMRQYVKDEKKKSGVLQRYNTMKKF